jgi:hypothetical protein
MTNDNGDRVLRVRHVYEHETHKFEERVNEVLGDLIREGAVVGDIKYVSDPPNPDNRRGGFGALIIYEARA